VDEHGDRHSVPPVIPETEDEKRRYEDAGRRRELRKKEQERRTAKIG
jgi:acyl-CoA hydrolase